MKAVLLASIGLHPRAKKPRIAREEARALALVAGRGDIAITVLHAGPKALALPLLEDLLGMGAHRLLVLDIPAEADPLPVLRDELRRLSPDIVLAGSRAETGEGSGLLPYLLAEELGLPLASGVTALALGCAEAAITVAAPGGRRRRLASSLPVLVAVDDKGPAPRLAAFGAKRRGEIAVTPAEATADARASWSSRPARPRPKRLSGPPAAGAAGAGREVRADLDAAAAAQTILTYLQQEGLAPRAPAPLRKSDTP